MWKAWTLTPCSASSSVFFCASSGSDCWDILKDFENWHVFESALCNFYIFIFWWWCIANFEVIKVNASTSVRILEAPVLFFDVPTLLPISIVRSMLVAGHRTLTRIGFFALLLAVAVVDATKILRLKLSEFFRYQFILIYMILIIILCERHYQLA